MVAMLAVWLLAACEPAAAPAPEVAKGVGHFFDIKVGDRTVRMQFAVSDTEMQRGLMERRDLGPDDGMIFVYRSPAPMSFWMRNTPTPLDIGYFTADGVLREIYPLHPHDETPVPSRRQDLQYALEMSQGWYRTHGIRPGAQLDLAAVAAALKARGFSPQEFGFRE